MKKIFASDYDGTLFFFQKNPPIRPEDKVAIQTFQKEHLFGLSTGRPLGAVLAMKDAIPYDFYITSNGATIFDKNLQVLFERFVSYQTVQALYEEYQAMTSFCAFHADNQACMISKEASRFEGIRTLEHIEALKTMSIQGLSLRFANKQEAALRLQDINAKYSDVVALQNDANLDIVAKGCNKGAGLHFVKAYFEADYSIGMGDSYNDYELLNVADLAMTLCHGEDAIKTIADHVVANVEEAIRISMEVKA